MEMNNRVYGVLGIKSINANFNADWEGNPKTLSDGTIIGGDKAEKYAIKKYWEDNNEKVMYLRSYKVNNDSKKKEIKFQPRTLEEKYKKLFDKTINNKNQIEVVGDLLKCIDIENFGCTFASNGVNLGIIGVIQFGQGVNKYEFTNIEVQDILSPFRNSNEKSTDSAMTTKGTKITTDEAHYFYGFNVCPKQLDRFKNIEGFEGYSKGAYDKFKEASLISTTALNTNSKFGCENEFGLFVELKEGSKLNLPDLSKYIDFIKDEENKENVIDLTKLEDILDSDIVKKEIKNVEIYYNSFDTKLKGDIKNASLINIITRDVVNK